MKENLFFNAILQDIREIHLIYLNMHLMKKKHIFIFTVLLFITISSSHNLFSQDRSKIDSLKQVLTTTMEDTNTVNTLNKLSRKYIRINMDTSRFYAEQALEQSKKISCEKCKYSSFINIGIAHYYQGSYDMALDYYSKALETAKKIDSKNYIGPCYSNIGMCYEKLGNFNKAIEYFLKNLKITEELNDKKAMAKCFNNIGIVHSNQGSFDKANEFYFKSLNIKEKLNDKRGMAECFNNIGVVHRKQGSLDKAIDYYLKSLDIYKELGLKRHMSYVFNNIGIIYSYKDDYDKALEYFFKSLKIKQELSNKSGIADSYTNIGSAYQDKGSYEKALGYYLKSLKIKKEIGDKYGISISYSSIASLNLTLADSVALNNNQKLNYLNKAVEYGNKSIELAREIEAMYTETDVAKTLMEAYKKLGNYKKSIEFAEVFISTQNSIFNEEKTKALQEMETKYETEKKNVEIQELKIKDIKNQNVKKTFQLVIAFLIIISILLIFFFRQKQKSNKILNLKNYQLNKLNETQSRLMSIISHDLKAPLSAFFSITSSLKSKIDTLDSTTIDDYFNRMLNSALAVKLQLENLLVWSITQSTEINVNKNNYDLSILAQKVIIILEEFSKEKSILLISKINEDTEIKTDGRLLSIVLNNLITNAIKFSDNNSKVEISATKDREKTLISVKDYGCGISKENLKKLFVGQSNMKHANKGTGLGLIVCKDIVDKLGGKIWAESEEGKGTTFLIEIHETLTRKAHKRI